MKTSVSIACLAVLLGFSALVSLWWAGRGVSQDDPPPLYAGSDSPGSIINPQDPNPANFFESRVDWPLLHIAQPRTAWEYTQRGIYSQDDVGDTAAALADYLRAATLERERSCGPGLTPVSGQTCLLIVHARLGNLYSDRGEYDKAIEELDFILTNNPLELGVHFELAEVYLAKGNVGKAIDEFSLELTNQPCHQATHFALGEVLLQEGREIEGRQHLTEYLQQTLMHCDPFPYKILKARKLLVDHGGPLETTDSSCPTNLKGPVSQVLSIPVSQITAQMGCNPVGTDFIEARGRTQMAAKAQ